MLAKFYQLTLRRQAVIKLCVKETLRNARHNREKYEKHKKNHSIRSCSCDGVFAGWLRNHRSFAARTFRRKLSELHLKLAIGWHKRSTKSHYTHPAGGCPGRRSCAIGCDAQQIGGLQNISFQCVWPAIAWRRR